MTKKKEQKPNYGEDIHINDTIVDDFLPIDKCRQALNFELQHQHYFFSFSN